MKDISGTNFPAIQHVANAGRVVFLLEIDADAPGVAPTTLYYGTRKFVLGSNTYADDLHPNGLQFSWARAQLGGGLSEVSTISASFRNEEKASNLGDTYFFENDEIRAYIIRDASSDADDRIELARGVIENAPWELRTWMIEAIDGSDKDFSEIPSNRINLVDYPDAPFDVYGKAVPVLFGAMNIGPHDGAGSTAFLAPARCTDVFNLQFTSGLENDVYGTPFQYYENAKRYAEIPSGSYTQTGSYFTIDNATRKLRLFPVLSANTNDVSGYSKCFDGNASTSVIVADTKNLDVSIGGSPRLGTVTAASVQINSTGTYGYDIRRAGSSLFSSASVSGNQTISLSNAATDHADRWDFELYEVHIAGHTSNPAVSQIYLEVTYSDQQTQDRQSLDVFQKATGWEDVTGNYNNGAVISSSGAPLDNPAHVLGAWLRGGSLMDNETNNVDATALTAAATARSGWSCRTALDTITADIEILNKFCFEFGLHLFKSFEGKWKVVAMDKSTVPAHTFLAAENIAIRNPADDPALWEWDFNFTKTPLRDVINEVALRYRLDRGTGQYTAIEIASGAHRVTGTCSVSAAGVLTDGSATFSTDGVQINEKVYIKGDKQYLVSAITETTLTITPTIGDVNEHAAGTTYYVGPSLHGDMKRSQLRYKTANPLGAEQKDFTSEGGYTSDFIGDSTTAGKVIDHLIEWRSQRRVTLEFATFLNAIDVELGDMAWVDHPWLPESKRPTQIGTLSAAVTSTSATTFQSAENQLLREDNFVLVNDREVVKVSAVDSSNNNFTVVRGQCNTVAITHLTGVNLKILNMVQFEVVGIKPPDLREGEYPYMRLELQEAPVSYKPVGRVVATGHPNWTNSTITQRATSGWATLYSGRVVEEDERSAVSHVGPSSGG